MSQNNLHILELLRRWLRGDANRSDEARLEQAAHSDEWLREALEGYQALPGADHAARLAAMRRQLAQNETRRRAALPWMRIAASLLLLIAAASAVVWYLQPDGQATPSLAQQSEATQLPPQPPSSPQPQSQPQSQSQSQSQSSPQPPATGAGAPTAPAGPPAGPLAAAYSPTAPEKPSAAADAAVFLSDDISRVPSTEARDMAVTQAEEAQEMAPAAKRSRPSEAAKVAPAPPLSAATPGGPPFVRQAGKRLISGSVTDPDGYPLIGAAVSVPGATQGTITDVDGHFSIQVDSSVQQLYVSYTGYNGQSVNLGPQDRQLTIRLEEGSSLSEVVVMGRKPLLKFERSTATSTSEQAQPAPQAEPVIGRRRYERYLRDHWPAGLPAGEATLAFTIASDGRPTEVKVISATQPELAAAAIQLLNGGASWPVRHGNLPFYTTYTFKKE